MASAKIATLLIRDPPPTVHRRSRNLLVRRLRGRLRNTNDSATSASPSPNSCTAPKDQGNRLRRQRPRGGVFVLGGCGADTRGVVSEFEE
ncbi:hypothetical protein LENED_002704 [Lentinula edodes]|uniref:Uncharacterized protein n=1 Tax=Lentinula edodes TaxID=5353 RepID=A0A1Q3E1K9_LENED|nr:hypothetical protein LENED_002704 [Lentinula edodes]